MLETYIWTTLMPNFKNISLFLAFFPAQETPKTAKLVAISMYWGQPWSLTSDDL